jgi:EAL domain-containing protein (putative c-di-GMP-specific phosphodiesterase class I)
VIVLQAIKGKSEVTRKMERLWRSCLAEPFHVLGTELRLAAKAGVTLFPNDGADAELLLRNGEAALAKAKELGERYVFYTSALTARTGEQLTLESRLRQALEKQEFVLHYQPKVDLEARRIVGVEALIRWQSPALGLVPPGDFIPLLEETGLILDVGAWAFAKAVEDHFKWIKLGLPAPRVAVNVSAIQLRRRDFVATVRDALKGGAVPPGVDLEITESLVMEDIESNMQKLKDVRSLGLSIAIDDFGTGYSSLGYLARLTVQTLKIDRSFIITMLTDSDTMTLVQTIISLAHSLRLKVVAEGVDEEEQAKVLRLLRCDEMQGFLFSRPVPFEQMTALLTNEPVVA